MVWLEILQFVRNVRTILPVALVLLTSWSIWRSDADEIHHSILYCGAYLYHSFLWDSGPRKCPIQCYLVLYQSYLHRTINVGRENVLFWVGNMWTLSVETGTALPCQPGRCTPGPSDTFCCFIHDNITMVHHIFCDIKRIFFLIRIFQATYTRSIRLTLISPIGIFSRPVLIHFFT